MSAYKSALLALGVHILHVISIKSHIFSRHSIYLMNGKLPFCHLLLTKH